MKSLREKQESKEFRELRKENIKLRREVKRLQKDNKHLQDLLSQYSEPINEVAPEPEEKRDKKNEPRCPSCFSKGIQVFMLKDKPYYQCDNCRSKGKMPEKS